MSEDILQKIADSDISLNEKKNLLAELRWNRERQVIDAAIEIELENLRWQKVQNQQAFESFTMNGQRFATYADSLPPGYGFQTSVSGMPAVSLTEPTQTDTENGADPPKYRTEQDLSRYRAMARFVTSVHCPGVGIVENLQNYIIGPGFTYTIRTKMGSKPPDGLVAAVQAFVDRFLDDNNWTGNLDRELLARSATDGEFFLDMLGDRDAVRSGRPRVEVVEPHFVTECGPWGEIQDRYNFPTNFTFGVHSHATRPARVLGYSIQDSHAWRYASTSQMVHHKRNVHVNAKRGVSDFFPAWDWMESQARLLRNTAAGAAELSAIAYILKYAGASESKVQSMLGAKADVTFTGPNGQTYYKQWKPPGSVINAPAGSEYEAGPAGSERGNAFLQVVQGILRQVATRWNMSEGMVSGDDSNNNMASAVVAGSRFHRYAICRQANLVHQYSLVVWKAIFIAYNAGAFAAYGFAPNRAGGEYAKLESLLELKVEPPPVDELSKGEQDNIYATRVNAGVMSKATWRSKVGLDDDVERENLKKEAAEQPQPPAAAPGVLGAPEGQAGPSEPDATVPGKRVDPKEELLSRQIQEDAVTPQDAPAKYSCLMAMLPAEDAALVLDVAKLVDPQDWADDGREMEPHCTVKYGFLTQDAGEVVPLVRESPAFTLTLGGLSLFPGKEYDVLKLDVSSPALVALNRTLSEALPHADSHPTYVPHVTIGYLKPGTGAKYAGRTCDVSGRVVPVKSLVFSPADGDRVTIPLRRMAAEAFCPTGEGGGIDNSCSSRDGDGSSGSAIKSVERGLKVSDTAAKFRDSEFLNRLRQVPATKMVSATPDAFLKSQEGMARSAYLTQHSSETLQQIISDGGKLWVSEDGKVGYALTKDGDIQNLFNNGGKNGEGKAALLHAIQNGAKTLDCFDGFLPRLYHQFGFRAYKSLPFSDEYAPAGWKYDEDGRPDVVMMVFAGDSREPERVAERAGQQSKYSDPARVFGYERDIREVEQGRHWIASEEAVRGRELGTETGRKPVEGSRGSVRSWTAGRVVSEDTPSVLALATATNAAEVLSIRRTCRAFMEQYGFEGMRQVLVEAFCPTGEGGGIDNSCSSRDGGSALADPAVKGKVERIKTQILDAQKQLKAAHARKSKHGIRRGKERLQRLYHSLGKMASQYDDGQPGSGGFEAPMPPHGGYMGKFVAGDGGERTASPKNDQSMKGDGAIGNAFAAHELSSAATGKMRTPFSTKESVYKAALETLDKSSDSYQAVLDMGEGLTEALGAKSLSYEDAKSSAKAGSREPVVLIAPPKGEKRATEKVEGKYKGDWSRLTDVARATVLVPMKDIPSTIEKLRVEMEERGWKIEPGSVDDRFSKPLKTGYRDVSMLLRAPNGMLAELQINTHEMWLAKEGDGHRLYEEFRTIDEKEVKTPDEIARAQQLSKQMSDLYDRAYQEMVRSSEKTGSGRGRAGESAVSRQRLLWEYP